MTALSLAMTGAVHTGACVAVPRSIIELAERLAGRFDKPLQQEYCLHDASGRPVGIIRATAGRPAVGRDAPTVYLRRTH